MLRQSAGQKRLNPLRLMGKLRPPQLGGGKVLPFLPGRSRVVRDNSGLPDVLGRIGSLEVRLARTRQDIRRAQRLRFRVFYEEMSASPNATALFSRRDVDAFDAVCDHILVIDHEPKKSRLRKFMGQNKGHAAGAGVASLVPVKTKPRVIGTYRLLRKDVADRHFGFYTSGEYDIAGLLAANPGLNFLELGRSCVLKPYRNKRTVELLWHGIWTYVLHHKIDVMLGCASLEGTDPNALATELSFLHHFARSPEGWNARALPARYTEMNRIPKDKVDAKAALKLLPPLIKGYLRLGATFGDGAVIDRQFGTTDVFVLLKVADIDQRYVNYYGADAGRHAA